MTYPIRLTSIANLLGWTLLALGLGSSTLPAAPISVEIQPVALNPERPEQLTVGKLLYRGGLVISSSTAQPSPPCNKSITVVYLHEYVTSSGGSSDGTA